FLKHMLPRINGLLGGQLIGIPPETALAMNAEAQGILATIFGCFTLVCLVVMTPVLRRDPAARFWGVVMVLAVVPAATVVPLSKNLAFVATGAFGIIASFFVNLSAPQQRAGMPSWFRILSWCVACWLFAAHIPGALAARAVLAAVSPRIPAVAKQACAIQESPELGDKDVVAI